MYIRLTKGLIDRSPDLTHIKVHKNSKIDSVQAEHNYVYRSIVYKRSN